MAALLFAVVVWRNLFPLADPDVWWHLKNGELMLKTWSIPSSDFFSYTIQGRPWLAFEWLAQVLFYGVYAALGFTGLTAFKALVVACAYLLFLSAAGGGFWGTLLLGAAAWTSGGLAERPLIFDPLFLGLTLRLLETSADPPWKKLGLLQILWANLHGGAALLGAGAAALKAFTSTLRRAPAAKWWAAAALCAAAMLVNPRGWAVLGHLHSTLSVEGRELINDWRPMTSLFNAHGLFFILAAASTVLSWREEPLLCLLSLALGVSTLSSVRNAALFEPAAAVLAARFLSRRLPVAAAWPTTALAGLAAVFFLQSRSIGAVERAKPAVEFLDRAGINGRMFNEYQLGDYLIWKAYPRRPVFIDGRGFEYGAEFIRDAVRWHEPATWAKLEARWHFDYAVLDNTTDYRARILDESGQWVPVFWDDACLVYLRREPANANAIKTYGYRYLRPNQADLRYLLPTLQEAKTRPGALAEIERAIAGSPFNQLALRMKAWTMAFEGSRAPRANHSPPGD